MKSIHVITFFVCWFIMSVGSDIFMAYDRHVTNEKLLAIWKKSADDTNKLYQDYMQKLQNR